MVGYSSGAAMTAVQGTWENHWPETISSESSLALRSWLRRALRTTLPLVGSGQS